MLSCYIIIQKLQKSDGLDPENPPKTIEELDSWSDAMTVKAADGSYNRLGIVPWLDSGNEAFILPYLFGADPYDKTTGKVDLTSDKMLNYMAWIQGYAKKYDPEKINAFTSGLGQMFSPDHPFMTGKVGMTITGNWFSEALKEYAPMCHTKYVQFLSPKVDAQTVQRLEPMSLRFLQEQTLIKHS